MKRAHIHVLPLFSTAGALVVITVLGGERNMKQRIPINSITSKLVLKSMYASCSTGPFFADHYSHRFEKTQLKFRQEK